MPGPKEQKSALHRTARATSMGRELGVSGPETDTGG